MAAAAPKRALGEGGEEWLWDGTVCRLKEEALPAYPLASLFLPCEVPSFLAMRTYYYKRHVVPVAQHTASSPMRYEVHSEWLGTVRYQLTHFKVADRYNEHIYLKVFGHCRQENQPKPLGHYQKRHSVQEVWTFPAKPFISKWESITDPNDEILDNLALLSSS